MNYQHWGIGKVFFSLFCSVLSSSWRYILNQKAGKNVFLCFLSPTVFPRKTAQPECTLTRNGCLLLGAYSLLPVISYDINSLDSVAEMACLNGVWLQRFWPFPANSLIRSWSQCWSWCSLASETKLHKSFVAEAEGRRGLAADTVQTLLKPNTWKKISRGRCPESSKGKVSSEY